MRKPNDEIGHWTFWNAHSVVLGRTVGLEGPTFAKARLLIGQWAATIHYLIGQVKAEAEKVPDKPSLMAPLLEAPTSSYASTFLASCGYYREAITVLRPLCDLVLWQWSVQARVLSARQLRSLRGLVGEAFDDKDLPRLFETEQSKIHAYQIAVNKLRNVPVRNELLEAVDQANIKKFRRELHDVVHGQPAAWNILKYPTLTPVPDFIGSEGVSDWFSIFQRLHRYLAVWCLLMFPDLMVWSASTPLEEEYGPGNHDVWWDHVLEPVQKKFFLELGTPPRVTH